MNSSDVEAFQTNARVFSGGMDKVQVIDYYNTWDGYESVSIPLITNKELNNVTKNLKLNETLMSFIIGGGGTKRRLKLRKMQGIHVPVGRLRG
jgi:hypothetical protein